MKTNKKNFIKSKKEKNKNIEWVKSDYNIKSVTKEPRLSWLIPLLLILILVFILFIILPRLVLNWQGQQKPEANKQVLEDEFLIQADGVIRNKVARLYSSSEIASMPKASLLFNEAIQLVNEESQNGFYEVISQDGLQGYIKDQDICLDTSSITSDTIINKVVVINGDKLIASDTSNGNIIGVAPMGSVLYADYVTEQIIRLVLPGNEIGWMSRDSVVVLPINDELSKVQEKASDIFTSSCLKFLNVPFVPAGLSLEGIDMPGVIYLAGQTNGIKIPRLIDDQAEVGYPISFERDSDFFPYIEGFKIGDLLFFSDFSGETIDSVGVFLGEDNVLYANGNQSKVEIISLTQNEKLLIRLKTVRRIFEKK